MGGGLSATSLYAYKLLGEIMSNFVEELVSEYFRTKGYFVMTNYWFPILSERRRNQREREQIFNARSWSDIDVVAINENELLIIQVKAIINQQSVSRKVVEFFQNVNAYLETENNNIQQNNIRWWLNGRTTKKILVYEFYSPPSYLNILTENDIQVVNFNNYFDELLSYVRNREGIKKGNSTLRFLHFLVKNNLIAQQ
jgi:hypothetical protein